jgi:hypothetical protein
LIVANAAPGDKDSFKRGNIAVALSAGGFPTAISSGEASGYFHAERYAMYLAISSGPQRSVSEFF